MKRVAIGLPALLLLAALIAVLGGLFLVSPRVYTVAQVVQGLQQHPGAWRGRIVLIHGVVTQVVSVPQCAAPPVRVPGSCHFVTVLHFGGTVWFARPPALGLAPGSALPLLHVMRVQRLLPVRPPVVPLPRPAVVLPPVRLRPMPSGPPTLIYVYPAMPELTVQLPPGVQPPAPAAHSRLSPALYNLPFLGPLLARLFPPDDGVTVRVHLLPHGCVATLAPFCSDGSLAAQ